VLDIVVNSGNSADVNPPQEENVLEKQDAPLTVVNFGKDIEVKAELLENAV
jgi:hypothetical protein